MSEIISKAKIFLADLAGKSKYSVHFLSLLFFSQIKVTQASCGGKNYFNQSHLSIRYLTALRMSRYFSYDFETIILEDLTD